MKGNSLLEVSGNQITFVSSANGRLSFYRFQRERTSITKPLQFILLHYFTYFSTTLHYFYFLNFHMMKQDVQFLWIQTFTLSQYSFHYPSTLSKVLAHTQKTAANNQNQIHHTSTLEHAVRALKTASNVTVCLFGE